MDNHRLLIDITLQCCMVLEIKTAIIIKMRTKGLDIQHNNIFSFIFEQLQEDNTTATNKI